MASSTDEAEYSIGVPPTHVISCATLKTRSYARHLPRIVQVYEGLAKRSEQFEAGTRPSWPL